MSGAFEYTRAEVTLTRVYYLADLGISGFDFDTAEDADWCHHPARTPQRHEF